MLNFAPLPDLLALTVLVFVFWSILRRRAGGKLQAWLLGWIFILLHFAAQLFGGRPGGLQTFVFAVSAIMLELAGASFIYAAGGAYYSRRMRWIAATGLLATLLYILVDFLSIPTTPWYYATIALLLGTGMAALISRFLQPRRRKAHVRAAGTASGHPAGTRRPLQAAGLWARLHLLCGLPDGRR